MLKGKADTETSARAHRTLLVRPREQFFRQACLAALALLLPLVALLIWLTAPTRVFPIAVAAIIATTAATMHLIVTYRRARVKATASGLQECGLWGWRDYIPHADIASIMLVSIYRGSTLDVEDHLFVIGYSGTTLLRLRGRYWATEDMHRIIDIAGTPATIVSEPQSLDEFRRENSRLLYRHEQRALPLLG